ncbi:hypothetical protein ACOMHN_014259 [Nucella lapillus]
MCLPTSPRHLSSCRGGGFEIFEPQVAITVYWVGRVAAQTYQGPRIDESAFAALVHNQHRHREHIVSDGQLRRDSSCSWDTNSHSSAYGSHEGGRTSRGSVKESCEAASGPRHVRDGSFDSYTSYDKGSEDSLDECAFEVDENGMPIPRYSSASALNQSTEGSRRAGGGERDSTMYSDKNSGLYQSSPDLALGSLSKRRSSSTDSTDGSHGGHSRQSSDSIEYTTRRYSVQSSSSSRRTSSADPLQYIKVKGANDLACTAEEQMKMAAESKKLKVSTSSISEDDNYDWQSRLTTWKNRRKSHSEKSYQLKEELEEMEREKDQPQMTATQSTKTFSQMQEERERRKSAGPKHFYPIEDEGEDDIFPPDTSEQKHSTPASRSSSRFQSSVASKEDSKDAKAKSQTKEYEPRWTRDSASNREGEEEGEEKKEVVTNSHNTSPPTPEPRSSRFSRETDNSASRQRQSGLPEYQEKKDQWQKQYSEPSARNSALKENNRNSANSSLHSRSSGKISNILKNFEQKEEEGAKSKPSVNNSSVNVGARKKSFENVVGRSGDVDSYGSWSTDRDKGSVKSGSRTEMSSHTSSSVYLSGRNSGKDYVEKTIKISQKANNDKGFGFILSGGADKKQPVVVEKVGLGSAADVCELQAKDEVISINGQTVGRLTSVELGQKVQASVRTGQIELRVKRFLGSGDDIEDEEDFLSTDEDVDTPDRSISKSSSIRAENSFDSLDWRDGSQKAEEEPERQWMEEPTAKPQNNRRGDPTSTSSDSGYDAQTFSPYHRGDNSSNEEEITLSQQQQTETRARPSLAARTKHLYPRDEDEDDYVNLRVTETTESSYKREFSEKEVGKEVPPAGEIEVKSRPTITLRRERGEVSRKAVDGDDDSKPAASSEVRHEATSLRREKGSEQTVSEDSDSGPPAVLRKWQRQRPRTEYTFDSDDSPKFYDQMKISSPGLSERWKGDTNQEENLTYKSSDDTDDTVSNSAPVVSSRRALRLGNDKERMRTWNQKQEEERQPAGLPATGASGAPVEISIPYEQQRFTTERDQIHQQYQHDLQRAAHSEQQKQEEENKLLEPEREKMRLLEERRAQRQARLQMYAQDLSADFSPPASSSSTPSSRPTPPRASQFGERQQQVSEQQHTSAFTMQVNSGKSSAAGSSEVLVIDPRNRPNNGEPVEVRQPGQPLQFQLKINSRETAQGLLIQPQVIPTHRSAPPVTDHAAFLEAEREKIRQEELQKIEAERQQREEEERRHMREKEERLRQQEEMLRQQQEELRKTQERLEQERQQLQHMSSAQQPSDYHSSSQNASQDALQFETVSSKVRGSSPVYTSTIVAGPRRSDRQQNSHSHADRNQDGYGVRRSEPSWSGARPHTASSWQGNVQTVSSSQSQLPKWPPAGADPGRNNAMPPQGSGQYSREDLMTMNRQATPLQGKPPPLPPTTITLMFPQGGKLPARARSTLSTLCPRRDCVRGISGQFSGPQDHWLVQEAERRRLNNNNNNTSSGYSHNPIRGVAQFSGPIKPATDSYGNRWREGGGGGVRLSPNMPAQIRQTLLQKTAGARGSTASNSSQEANPPGPHYQHDPAFSQTLPRDFGYGGGYPPSSRSEPLPPQHHPPLSPGDAGVNISGKQRCSHCNQELGFGAAMVIESLGLYYHTQCFKCCVCRTPLGSGVEGADVRVRVNKLHCPNCYSNDEGTRPMAAR